MRRLLVAAALVAVFVLPASAVAAPPGMTIQLGRAQLVSRISVRVPVTFTCQPMQHRAGEDAWWEEAFVGVSIQQVVGNRQAFGDGGRGFDPDVMCDASPHTLTVTVRADRAGAPFKAGRAWIDAVGSATYWIGDEEDGQYVDQRASIEQVGVRLRRMAAVRPRVRGCCARRRARVR